MFDQTRTGFDVYAYAYDILEDETWDEKTLCEIFFLFFHVQSILSGCPTQYIDNITSLIDII